VYRTKNIIRFLLLKRIFIFIDHIYQKNISFIKSDNSNKKNLRMFEISNTELMQRFSNNLMRTMRKEFARTEVMKIWIIYLWLSVALRYLKRRFKGFKFINIPNRLIMERIKWSITLNYSRIIHKIEQSGVATDCELSLALHFRKSQQEIEKPDLYTKWSSLTIL
jgi:hypothetical protein